MIPLITSNFIKTRGLVRPSDRNTRYCTRAILVGRKKKPTSHETSSLILYILSSGGDITPHRGAACRGGGGLLEAAAVRESSLHAVTNERRALVRTYL